MGNLSWNVNPGTSIWDGVVPSDIFIPGPNQPPLRMNTGAQSGSSAASLHWYWALGLRWPWLTCTCSQEDKEREGLGPLGAGQG